MPQCRSSQESANNRLGMPQYRVITYMIKVPSKVAMSQFKDVSKSCKVNKDKSKYKIIINAPHPSWSKRSLTNLKYRPCVAIKHNVWHHGLEWSYDSDHNVSSGDKVKEMKRNQTQIIPMINNSKPLMHVMQLIETS